MGQTYLQAFMGQYENRGTANGQNHARGDNESAVRVATAERARSPAMTEALRIAKEEEGR